MKHLLCCLFTLFFCVANVYAVEDQYSFDSPEKEKVFNELITELRCPQCQNNNIADSNAGISDDMKAKVYELVQQENFQKEQVVEFMTKRYGDFITYRPPVTAGTIILWLMPIIVILIGLLYLVLRSGKKASEFEDNSILTEGVPKAEMGKLDLINHTPVSRRGWLLGFAFLLTISIAIYVYVGGWQGVMRMSQAQQRLPELKSKFIESERVDMQDMEDLILGLRTDVFKHPDNVDNWVMLGGIYMWMNDAASAKTAFRKAYQQDPQNLYVRSLYGRILVQSDDPVEYPAGIEILKGVVKENNKDVEAISALAFDAFNNENYQEALELCEYLSVLLPPDNPKAKMYEKMAEHARALLENEQSNPSPSTQN